MIVVADPNDKPTGYQAPELTRFVMVRRIMRMRRQFAAMAQTQPP